jgi:uncharacterized protein YndB with AHSA1/START domain
MLWLVPFLRAPPFKQGRSRPVQTIMDSPFKELPVAKTGMLIRRPLADVFAAFVDPEITTMFWFTKSSGCLTSPKQIKWEWEMYNASTTVDVKAIEPGRRIFIEWDGYSGRTMVEWKFAPQKKGTFVSVTESGWTGNADKIVNYVNNSTQGFTWTLAGLKGWLERNHRLNYVADRFPQGLDEPYPDE